jgi:hypothetical protein
VRLRPAWLPMHGDRAASTNASIEQRPDVHAHCCTEPLLHALRTVTCGRPPLASSVRAAMSQPRVRSGVQIETEWRRGRGARWSRGAMGPSPASCDGSAMPPHLRSWAYRSRRSRAAMGSRCLHLVMELRRHTRVHSRPRRRRGCLLRPRIGSTVPMSRTSRPRAHAATGPPSLTAGHSRDG